MIEGLLRYMGLDKHWITMLLGFMTDRLGFLVANRLSDTWVRPDGSIRQGDSSSPAIHTLIPATHCGMLNKALPTATVLVYADDTLLWLQSNLQEIKQQLK